MDSGTTERATPTSLARCSKIFDRRIDRVIAFLASLEMAKMGMLDIDQEYHLGRIQLTGRLQPNEADFSILMGERIMPGIDDT